MVDVRELTLPHLPIDDPAFAADPLPAIRAAQAQHPWLAISDYGYIVHEYQAVRDLSYMDDKFNPSMDGLTEIMGAKGTRWGDFMNNLMLAKDPPEHTRLRDSVARSFTPRVANRMRPVMRETVSALLDEWAPKGAFDFTDFAAHFPIRVMYALIGAPLDTLPGIQSSLELQGLSASANPALLPALEGAYEILCDFADTLVADRERDGGGAEDDVLNRLIASKNAGQLNTEELRNMLIFLFAAGYDTSKNMLALILYVMLREPEKWARCAVDRAYCDKVVEEVFRYHSVSNIYRTPRAPLEYRGVTFPTDAVLIITLTFASRDDRAVADADVFDPERTDGARHVAFGRGLHMCLGQHLARAQIQEAVHLIARALRKPELAGEITWRPFPGVWGIKSLPIRFTPGEANAPELEAAA